VDFFCSEERLIAEVDGPIHATRVEADRARQELIESLGLRFVRISADLVEQDLPRALEAIRAAFGPPPPAAPGPPPPAAPGPHPQPLPHQGSWADRTWVQLMACSAF
jgi:adenine-specific DNA-methyltransferase